MVKPSTEQHRELPEPTITPYQIIVHHGETFAQRIKRLVYICLHPWITNKNTPVAVNKKKGNEDKEVFVVHLNCSIESDDVVIAMTALDPPLKPGVHEDLIAFGTDHPDVRRKFPVVQLGTSWAHPDRGRVVSYLLRCDVGRVLYLRSRHVKWSSSDRFLAVRA